MSFRDELRASLRTKNEIDSENARKLNENIERNSLYAIKKLKEEFLNKAKNADYQGNVISACIT